MAITTKNLLVIVFSAVFLFLFEGLTFAQSGSRPVGDGSGSRAPTPTPQPSARSQGFAGTTLANIRGRNSASQFSAAATRNRVLNSSVATTGVAGINQRNFLSSRGGGNFGQQRSKPFSAVTRGPTVSPYLALSAPRASASDYQNFIRPQQQINQQAQRQQALAIQQQRRLNQLAARSPIVPTGDVNSAPTGHSAVFQSLGSYQQTGSYFPPPTGPKRFP